MAAWSRKTLKKSIFFVFWKNDPLREKFQSSIPKDSSWHRSTCCIQMWNFADIRKSVKSCVAYLTNTRYCADRAQNLPEPARPRQCTQSAPDFIQIGSLLAKLPLYIRTREHRQNALESESNIWLKPSFDRIIKIHKVTCLKHRLMVSCCMTLKL